MNELVIKDQKDQVILSSEIIKKYICPTATDQEVYMFFQLCRSQNLNPFMREAYLIKYGDEKASMVVGKETFTKRADSLPDCDGFEAGIIVLDNDGKVVYRKGAFIVEGESLLGGWANVYRKSRQHPYHIEVSKKEYERFTKNGDLTKPWREMPATMIRKTALVQALREAYPQDFANMFTPEEMPVDNLPEYTMGKEIPPPTIPMPQRKSEAVQEGNPFAERNDDESRYLTIAEVTEKHGEKNGKPWTKYYITTSDGVIYSTFSGTLADRAKDANTTGATVSIEGEEGKYGWELKDLSIIVNNEPTAVEKGAWTIEKIIDIITSSDDIGILEANWKSLLPQIGKLNGKDKAEAQKAYDETKKFIKEAGVK